MNAPGTPQRRFKVPATVTPSRVVGALHAKLSAAQWALFQLQQAEQPTLSASTSHHSLVIQFLRPARGVYPVAKTFHQGWVQGEEFVSWAGTWQRTLTPAELTLWHYMQDQRDWDEHGDGADLMPVSGPVMHVYQMPYNAALYGVGPEGQPLASKGSVRFRRYPDVPAGSVCGDYMALCRRFVDDYLSNPVHVAVIPAPGSTTT